MAPQLLLDLPASPREGREDFAPGAALLRGFALASAPTLLTELRRLLRLAPWRHLVTPGGARMSVGMTNAGPLGWVSDRAGYRYAPRDPQTGAPWPALPGSFLLLARAAAEEAGYPRFSPDACLVNRYVPGARLTLHQDRNERDLSAPIVSVSLGLPATFLFGGLARGDRARRIALDHGDVAVWGGPSRLCFHGVLPVKDGSHPSTGGCRINLTFRKVV